jgi:hypothetical protein
LTPRAPPRYAAPSNVGKPARDLLKCRRPAGAGQTQGAPSP